MVGVRIYVEGGGDSLGGALATECRRAFRELFVRAGFRAMPRVIACGGRQRAFEMFRDAVETHYEEANVLLVDAEEPVAEGGAWAHLARRDGWTQPSGVGDDRAHLMVQCMEAWLLADPVKLSGYFAPGFREAAIRKWPQIEAVSKADLMKALELGTRDCRRGRYSKGTHSFKILATVDPTVVRSASPHAERFFATVARLLSSRARGGQ